MSNVMNMQSENAISVDGTHNRSEIAEVESMKEKQLKPEDKEYPEGGVRGWSVAIGAATILFSSFGYANAFG